MNAIDPHQLDILYKPPGKLVLNGSLTKVDKHGAGFIADPDLLGQPWDPEAQVDRSVLPSGAEIIDDYKTQF